MASGLVLSIVVSRSLKPGEYGTYGVVLWLGSLATQLASMGLANTTARPQGPRGPTPAQSWAARRQLAGQERAAFASAVQRLEAAARTELRIAPDAGLDHHDHAALHRRVLEAALVQGGYLLLTRRRIPQRLLRLKRASIR